MPPVSTSSKNRSSDVQQVRDAIAGDAGLSSTMASRLPASQLKRLDLPTFGRPTMTTCGTPMREG